MADYLKLKKTTNEIRRGTVTAIHNAKSDYPGGSLSSADISTYLYFKEMNVDPRESQMPGRDHSVLSKDHVAPGYYSTLTHHGFFPVEDLKTLRHTGSYLQGHPDKKHIPGVGVSSGPSRQGILATTGMASSTKLQMEDYQVYTLYGDGKLEEGQVQEAAMLIGFCKLNNLAVIVDNNGLQIDGVIDEACSPHPIDKKFEAFQFHAISIDGHDFGQIERALEEARQMKGRPAAVIAKTLKGKGVSFMEGSVSWRGVAPNDEQYVAAMEELERAEEVLCQE